MREIPLDIITIHRRRKSTKRPLPLRLAADNLEIHLRNGAERDGNGNLQTWHWT